MQPKVKVISLTTSTTSLGDECVERDPPPFAESRKNIDVIRILNANPADSELGILVQIDTDQAGHLFDPVPAKEIELDPGEHVDWKLKPIIGGQVGMKFRTDPGNCKGHDQDDFIIRP